jgi:hypothetical protein
MKSPSTPVWQLTHFAIVAWILAIPVRLLLELLIIIVSADNNNQL